MDKAIFPECYIETMMLEVFFNPKKGFNHQKGYNTIFKKLKSLDDFALAIIDRDKIDSKERELRNFEIIVEQEKLILYKCKQNNQYIIVIVPAMEKFLIDLFRNYNMEFSDYNLPETIKELKNLTKKITTKHNSDIRRLFIDLYKRKKEIVEINILVNWIDYIKSETYSVSIEKLKEISLKSN